MVSKIWIFRVFLVSWGKKRKEISKLLAFQKNMKFVDKLWHHDRLPKHRLLSKNLQKNRAFGSCCIPSQYLVRCRAPCFSNGPSLQMGWFKKEMPPTDRSSPQAPPIVGLLKRSIAYTSSKHLRAPEHRKCTSLYKPDCMCPFFTTKRQYVKKNRNWRGHSFSTWGREDI